MFSLYDAAAAPLKRTLTNLKHILNKGLEHADSKKIEHPVFLNARLFPDMFQLTRQVQIATDMSKGAMARLAGVEIPKYEDNESSFEELQARIDKTIAFIDSIQAQQFEGAENKDITINVRKVDMHFKGQAYLLSWVLPNVYFHVTTAYNILRHNGVELGKPDFLGPKADN